MKTITISCALLCLTLVACDNNTPNSSAHMTLMKSTANAGPLYPYCAQCHAPPSPRLHKADVWTAVVLRMERHRLDARMPAIPDAVREKLLAWLQQHAQH